MYKLLPILIFSLILAYLSDRSSVSVINEYGEREYIYKEKFLYFVMAFAMAFFVGLRTSGNDTYTYSLMYEAISANANVRNILSFTSLAGAPGLEVVCVLIKRLGATTQDYFMLFALFTVITYMWFVRKYTTNIWLSVFYFFTMDVYTFTMAAIKQTVAVAFLLIATDRAIEKKWWRFLFWVAVAELFHPYAFVYLVVSVLTFAPWTQRTYWLLGGTAVVAVGLQRFVGGILAMTDALGYNNYTSTEFLGVGVNIFRVAVVWVPVVISFFFRDYLKDSNDRTCNIVINLSMMNALIMFIGLFGTANYFARLANYFLIFQCLALPLLLQYFSGANRRIITTISCFAFIVYFYYQMVMAQGRFDDGYTFMKVSEFFAQLFGGGA